MEILTKKEAAELIKISDATMNYLISTGQIPFIRIGKRGVRFSKKRLEEWFMEREGIEFRLKRKTK